MFQSSGPRMDPFGACAFMSVVVLVFMILLFDKCLEITPTGHGSTLLIMVFKIIFQKVLLKHYWKRLICSEGRSHLFKLDLQAIFILWTTWSIEQCTRRFFESKLQCWKLIKVLQKFQNFFFHSIHPENVFILPRIVLCGQQ